MRNGEKGKTEKPASGETREEKKKKRKRKAVGSAVAAVTAAGVMVNGLFGMPEDLMAKDPSGRTPAIIMMTESQTPVDEDSGEEADDSEKDEKRTWLKSLKAWILRLPLAVRTLVGVPLWALGWGAVTGLTALWSTFLSPVVSTVLNWLLAAGVIILVYAVVAKACFPRLPLKKILSFPNLRRIIIGTACCGAVITVAPLFWKDFSHYKALAQFFGGLAVLTFAFFRIRKIHKFYDPDFSKARTGSI